MDRRMFAVLVVLSLGCTMPNPAFDSADASSSEAGTVGPGTSDTDEPDSGVETGAETGETGETGEPPVEVCEFELRPALKLEVRMPPDGGNVSCPLMISELSMLVLTEGLNIEPGMAEGTLCDDFYCSICGDQTVVAGAPGFAGLEQTWDGLGDLATNSGTDGVCVEVTALGLIGGSGGSCFYGAMGIFDNSIGHGPVFAGQVDDAPLTWIGAELLQQQPVVRGAEPIATCSCEATFPASSTNLGCCLGSDLEPSFYSLSSFGLELAPGEAELLPNAAKPWTFHALQSQNIPTCENLAGEAEVSWALTLDP